MVVIEELDLYIIIKITSPSRSRLLQKCMAIKKANVAIKSGDLFNLKIEDELKLRE